MLQNTEKNDVVYDEINNAMTSTDGMTANERTTNKISTWDDK